MRLKVVLLPEPFGPMSPRISLGFTSNDTRFTAVKPPNSLVRPLTDSIALRQHRTHGRATRWLLVRIAVALGPRQHRVGGAQARSATRSRCCR